jgi:hypothetical protein
LLPYCITEPAFTGPAQDAGVNNSAVENLTEGPLRCFYSEIDNLPAVLREDALRFHRVVSGIFRQAAVISIRFPTLLRDKDELRGFLRKHSQQYAAALERLRNSIQMELHISAAHQNTAGPHESGKAYLEARRSAVQKLVTVTEHAYSRVRHLAAGWRVRAGSRPDLVYCYALVARDAEQDFRNQIESMPASQSTKVAVSGPWPCSEFLE